MLLLTDVRKKLLALWLGFTSLLLLFFLLQVLNGKYTGMESTAWAWIFVQLLPGLTLLLTATLLHLNRGKAILRGVFWAIFGLVALFLVFVLVSLAGISGGSAGQSLGEGFSGSYRYLLPLQALVLVAFGVLFFKKESLFQPNIEMLRGHAQELSTKAKNVGAMDQQRAIDFFVAADLPSMLDFLEEKIKIKKTSNQRPPELLMLKNRLSNYQKNVSFDLISAEEARKEYAHICFAALGLVEEI